ncbi:MAG: S9 family peptidase, partial [bacterium]
MKFAIRSLLLCIMVSTLPVNTFAQKHIELDVETIMQDPKTWVGTPPRNPYWSEDSKWIYFLWNPEAADSDSLYKVSVNGGPPIKLSKEERMKVPPPGGVYSRDYRTKLFVRNGDIFLYNVRQNSTLQLTSTSDRESNPRFSQNEKSVIFQKGMNLFQWDRKTGATRQITDFQKGKKPEADPQPGSDAEKFVKHEELDLIQVVRERKERNQKAKEAREAENPNVPAKIYIGDKSVRSPALSPDSRFVTFQLLAKDKAKRTIVPDYVTETGFTVDLNSRPKVGQPQRASQFAFFDLQEDTLIIVKPDSLPGIFEPQELTQITSRDGHAKNDIPPKNKKQKPRTVQFYSPVWSDNGQHA